MTNCQRERRDATQRCVYCQRDTSEPRRRMHAAVCGDRLCHREMNFITADANGYRNVPPLQQATLLLPCHRCRSEDGDENYNFVCKCATFSSCAEEKLNPGCNDCFCNIAWLLIWPWQPSRHSFSRCRALARSPSLCLLSQPFSSDWSFPSVSRISSSWRLKGHKVWNAAPRWQHVGAPTALTHTVLAFLHCISFTDTPTPLNKLRSL